MSHKRDDFVLAVYMRRTILLLFIEEFLKVLRNTLTTGQIEFILKDQ